MPNPDGTLTVEEYAAQAIAGMPAPTPPIPVEWMLPREALVAATDPASHASTQLMAAQQAATAGQDPRLAAAAVPPPMDVAAGIASRATVQPEPVPQPIPSPFPATPQAPASSVQVGGMMAGALPVPSFANSEAVASQGAQALQREGEAKAALGSEQSAALAQQQAEAQQLQDHQTQARAELNSEIDRQAQDIASQKIDPKRLWNSKTDGERAMSLIGIVLSGMGSGLTGGPNLALQVIDRQIERDINAQTAEMGKKENLLSALYRKYGNLEQAQNMARVFKTEAFARELQSVAARRGGEAERAHAELVGTQLRAGVAQAKDQAAYQLGMMRYQMSMVNGAGGGQYENAQHATRPEGFDLAAFAKATNTDKERTLPPRTPGGKPVLAHSNSAALDARNRLVGINGAHELLRQIEQERGPSNVLPWSNDNVKAQAKLAGLAYELARAYTGGVPNESAVKDAEGQLRGPFMAYVRGQSSYQPVLDILESQKNSVYQTFAPGVESKVSVPFKPVR